MNIKKMNLVYGIVFVLIIGLVAFFATHKKLTPADIQPTANNTATTGTQQSSPALDEAISEVPQKSALSPDNTKIAYAKWDASISKTEIFIANADGSNEKLIATQVVGDGNGELDKDSIEWSADGKYVTYFETQMTCEGNCQNPADAVNLKITYQVNIETGEKNISAKAPLEQN